jgi:para-aminobenzoate synthetase component 1
VQQLANQFGTEGLVWLDGDGSGLGRWSRIGINPLEQLVCRGLPGQPEASDPFAALAAIEASGGPWMGWLAYEAGVWVEPAPHWSSSDMAVLWAAQFDPILVVDHQSQTLWLEGSTPHRLEEMASAITAIAATQGSDVTAGAAAIPLDAWTWHTSSSQFAEQVAQIRDWIAQGDVFQANLTACCEASTGGAPDPLGLYLRLRSNCPAPFGGLAIAAGAAAGEAVLSSSPERFLRVDGQGLVETRPIKGTRPRHVDPQADAAEAAQLITSPKDRAENVMIVDLLRNDLGRVCQPGSIHVPQLVGLESYRQVHHLTSVVEGVLQPGQGVVDLLRATWPGGSITGAPKIRACQRLAELEPVPRGPYCGSLFWLGPGGSFDSNILIRSLLIKDQRLRVHAGCGIVTDSDPAAEAEEMGWKLKPLLEALA